MRRRYEMLIDLTYVFIIRSQMGYGARALEALGQFYKGELSNLDDLPETEEFDRGHKPSKVCL